MLDFQELIEREIHADHDPDSHVETDPWVFHPSQIAKCERQAVIGKYGLEEHDTETLGTFKIGTIIHGWLEDRFDGSFPGVEFETPVEKWAGNTGDGVKFVGRADVVDRHEGIVYDFKTRSSWYKFDPPVERHVDQLTVYMAATGATEGQVVYICKKNLEVRTWPESGYFAFDKGRWNGIVEKANRIATRLQEGVQPGTVEDVPFKPCGCWLCDREGEQ